MLLYVQVVKATWAGGSPTPVFNNAAQAWNHKFFWSCMKSGGGGESQGLSFNLCLLVTIVHWKARLLLMHANA